LLVENWEKQWLTSSVEDLVMFLNRAVVLECPHLDVPWFRDRASKVFLDKGRFSIFVFIFCCTQANSDLDVFGLNSY